MICFGAKTDQEVKEKVTYESHKKKIIKREEADVRSKFYFYFFSFSFLISLLSSI